MPLTGSRVHLKEQTLELEERETKVVQTEMQIKVNKTEHARLWENVKQPNTPVIATLQAEEIWPKVFQN